MSEMPNAASSSAPAPCSADLASGGGLALLSAPANFVDDFLAYSEDQPRDKDGKFGSGGSGGKSAEDKGNKTKVPAKGNAKAERAKASYCPATKEKQDQGDKRQRDVAKIIGHEVSDDNKPMDVLGRDKNGKNTAVEVKTLCDAKIDKITMRKECRERKETYARKEEATLFTVAVDDRDHFEGGKHASSYAGARYRMAEGVGSFRLGGMTPVSPAEMKAVVHGDMKLSECKGYKSK